MKVATRLVIWVRNDREFLRFFHHFFKLLYFVRGVIFFFIVIIIVCTALLMAAEGLPIGESLYLTAITALTVGYGDISPKTSVGQVVSVMIGIVGVIFVGIVVAVATRALHQAVEEKKQHEETLSGDDGRA